ncbi:MAG: nicotinamidase [Candidatus Pacebacteria bacterium]|nr:nicotinamidase [Candidatus Paceibacterota bacterium]
MREFQLPPHYDPKNAYVSSYRPDPAVLMAAANYWRDGYDITRASQDSRVIYALDIDDQSDFDYLDGALFVAGRSGTGAMDALRRRSEFRYRYLPCITQFINTMDTHVPFQIFFPVAHIDASGNHPAPHTQITADEYRRNYRPNPLFAYQLGVGVDWLRKQFIYYCEQLERAGKPPLTIWPYHCLKGSYGHRLAGLIEEVRLFHGFVRGVNNPIILKGENPLTEHYSIFAPEVTTTHSGGQIVGAERNVELINKISSSHRTFLDGEAGSHCVPASGDDLLTGLIEMDPSFADKVVFLRDCMTPVVVPGVVDYTEHMENMLTRFQERGAHVVDSTDYEAIDQLIFS